MKVRAKSACKLHATGCKYMQVCRRLHPNAVQVRACRVSNTRHRFLWKSRTWCSIFACYCCSINTLFIVVFGEMYCCQMLPLNHAEYHGPRVPHTLTLLLLTVQPSISDSNSKFIALNVFGYAASGFWGHEEIRNCWIPGSCFLTKIGNWASTPRWHFLTAGDKLWDGIFIYVSIMLGNTGWNCPKLNQKLGVRNIAQTGPRDKKQ